MGPTSTFQVTAPFTWTNLIDQVLHIAGKAAQVAWVFAVAGLLQGCGSSSDALDTLVASLPRCEGCALEAFEVWRTGAADPLVNAAGSYLQVGDRLATTGETIRDHVVEYDLEGGPTRVWGRRGEGPGEFRRIGSAATNRQEDVMAVGQPDRVSFFDHERRFLGSFPTSIPFRGAMVLLDDSTVVYSNARAEDRSVEGEGRAGADLGLHRFDARGRHLLSFLQVDTSASWSWVPLAAGHRRNSVWAMMDLPDGFRAVQLDALTGSVLRDLSVVVPWWYRQTVEEQREGERGGLTVQESSGATALFDLGEILLVTLRQGDAEEIHDRVHYTPHVWFNSVVLVLDPTSGDILASLAFDPFAYGFTNRGLLVLYDEGLDGHPRISLQRLTFSQG